MPTPTLDESWCLDVDRWFAHWQVVLPSRHHGKHVPLVLAGAAVSPPHPKVARVSWYVHPDGVGTVWIKLYGDRWSVSLPLRAPGTPLPHSSSDVGQTYWLVRCPERECSKWVRDLYWHPTRAKLRCRHCMGLLYLSKTLQDRETYRLRRALADGEMQVVVDAISAGAGLAAQKALEAAGFLERCTTVDPKVERRAAAQEQSAALEAYLAARPKPAASRWSHNRGGARHSRWRQKTLAKS